MEQGNKKLNVFSLDYEGFDTSRSTYETMAVNNKLMYIAYTVSNIIIFSLHSDELNSFREFISLVKSLNVKMNELSKKPSLLIFINISKYSEERIRNNEIDSSVRKNMTNQQLREKIKEIVTKSLVDHVETFKCHEYFKSVIVEGLFSEEMQTDMSDIQTMKKLVNKICFNVESMDVNMLFDEEYWKNTIDSINNNHQIETVKKK